MKDRGEEHFEVIHNSVSNDELAVRLEKYVKHGTPFAKNKLVLTSKNLSERCICFLKFKSSKGFFTNVTYGTYIPYAQWVVPCTCGEMDSVRTIAMWKCMVSPSSLMLEDIC